MATIEECTCRYGLAPHSHDFSKTGSILGSTVFEPEDRWPKNFTPDGDAEGMGYWTCDKCIREWENGDD